MQSSVLTDVVQIYNRLFGSSNLVIPVRDAAYFVICFAEAINVDFLFLRHGYSRSLKLAMWPHWIVIFFCFYLLHLKVYLF